MTGQLNIREQGRAIAPVNPDEMQNEKKVIKWKNHYCKKLQQQLSN